MKVYQGLSEFRNIVKPVLTIGTFDGVHIGHQKIIGRINEIAQEIGGQSVLLTFDPHPRKVLSPYRSLEMITTMNEKIELLKKAGLQHLIIHPFTEDFARMKPELYIRDLLVNGVSAHTVVVGYDHRYGRNREGDFALIQDLSSTYQYEVEEISAKAIEDINVSSTKIRKAIYNGDMVKASLYLGHDYIFKGEVEHGNKRGRKIGFPTANLHVNKDKILPDTGVFAVHASVDGERHLGMLNIGYKPTMNDDPTEKTVEVHLFDFSKEIYGRTVSVCIIKKLRDERKFDSIEDLVVQLHRDKNQTLNII